MIAPRLALFIVALIFGLAAFITRSSLFPVFCGVLAGWFLRSSLSEGREIVM